MTEATYVELPVLHWLCGDPKSGALAGGLGWTYRDEAAMAVFDRPLEDPLVEKLLVAAILRINSRREDRGAGQARGCCTAQDDVPPGQAHGESSDARSASRRRQGRARIRVRMRRRCNSSLSIRTGRT